MSSWAIGCAAAALLCAAAALGAYALGRRAGKASPGGSSCPDAVPDDARRRALEALGVGVILVDRAGRGRTMCCNAEARSLLGLPAAAPGRRREPSLSPALRSIPELDSLVASGEGGAELVLGEGSGRRRIEARAFPLGRRALVVLSDVTASAALLEELSTLASQDALTGIFNRRRFDELGERDIELSRRSLSSVGAIMLDIDWFKRVNDERGHSVGDEVLKTVTHACKDALRSSDILGRYGGEEFAVLLPGSGAVESLAVAERIREHVAARALPCNGESVSVTISLGVYSGVPALDEDLALFLHRADEALYRSKALGRNKASYWTPL
jgi:diguanylate cyclase (GGDEF)-like protein